MTEYWYYKCLKCEEKSKDDLKDGDKILLNFLNHIDTIKILLDADEYGLLEISIIGVGTEPINFLMQHYGHEIIVTNEYGKIKRINGKIEDPFMKLKKVHTKKEKEEADKYLDYLFPG